MKTFAIYSLGCKVNSYESNAIASMFENDNYLQVNFKDKADVYIINTCTVTNTGDAKSRKIIRQAIKRNKDAIICVFGCYAQVSPDEILEIEGVDIVLGTKHRHLLLDMVNNHHKNETISHIENIFDTHKFEDFSLATYTANQRAYLKIQEGCNKFCTYCIIPYARGLMRSRDKENIILEASDLIEKGYQEIILTGIHTGGYGEELENYNFDDLLEEILTRIPNLKRLRISSVEINQITSKTLQLFKKYPALLPHLHIPLQSGSAHILKEMKRDYTKEEYLKKIIEIRKALPDIALTTDLIVGFPDESEEDFLETLDFIQEVDFYQIHVFPYSKRKNTPAAKMPNQIAETIKKERVEKVIDISKKLERQYINKFISKESEIIVEGYDDDKEMFYGHSKNYLKIFLKGKTKKGNIEKVNLISNYFYPIGELSSNETK